MFPACPVRNILARLCDKWALLVLYLLARSEQGKLRFTELKQAMPDISRSAARRCARFSKSCSPGLWNRWMTS